MRSSGEYDAKIDVKKRLTPRELVKPFSASRRTLKMMDSSIANLKKGMVSDPIDLPPSKTRRRE
jgi:hypothetical protein